MRRGLVIADGDATAHALSLYLADHGLRPKILAKDKLHASAISAAELIIAEAEDLADIEMMFGQGIDGRRPYFVCLAPIGDTTHEVAIRAGVADDVIGKPVSRSDMGELLIRLDNGRPRRRAVLENHHVPAAEVVQFTGAHVLVADDSPVNREVVVEALKRLDITCETVENGLEAVEAFSEHEFDAVLIDCSMPVMDGFTATREIRRIEAERARKRVPIIALTAHVAGLSENNWQQVGMDEYLTKPFRLNELTEVFERFLRRPDEMAERESDATKLLMREGNAGDETLPVIDENVLDAYADFQEDGSSDLVDRLLGLFLRHAPEALAEIERKMHSPDGEALSAAAHALKSMGRNIGAARLCAACEELERTARDGEDIDPDEHVATISSELELVRQQIEEFRAEPDPVAATA